MSTEWSHLPNAAHIDRVLAHLKAHPDKWAAATAALGAARDAALGAAWDAVWDAARDEAWDAAWDAARGAARDAARGAAWAAVAALIACDDCAYLLDYDEQALRALTRMQPDNYAAVLLLPAAVAMKEK